MRYLVALKPLTHDTNHDSFAVLVEVDWDQREVVRSVKIPSANFSSDSGYMRSHIQGLSVYDNKVYLSFWNFIAIIDYETFQVIDSFSHPLMTDLHGICITSDHILVCATAIDGLLCFDRKNQELKWSWRPDDSILSSKMRIPNCFNFVLKKTNLVARLLNWIQISKKALNKMKISFYFKDFRGIDKTRTMLHFHHLNEVNFADGRIYLLTKGWNDSVSSSLIVFSADDVSNSPEFIAKPATFKGAHDIVFKDSAVYVTESNSESVARLDIADNGSVKHWRLTDTGYFVRGLCDTEDDTFLVGFTPSRNKSSAQSRQPLVREYSASFDSVKTEMLLDGFYSERVGGAVHCIKRSPIL